jgi:hypothetical protein
MPDRDNWTAAMVLKWVLTRDLPTVLAMVDTYGAWIVSEDSVLRAVPEDLDALMISFCVDPALPPGEKRNRNAVLRSHRVIEAKAEVYRVLRRRRGPRAPERYWRRGENNVRAVAQPEIPVLERA